MWMDSMSLWSVLVVVFWVYCIRPVIIWFVWRVTQQRCLSHPSTKPLQCSHKNRPPHICVWSIYTICGHVHIQHSVLPQTRLPRTHTSLTPHTKPQACVGEAGSRWSVYSRRMNKGKTLVCLYWNWITAFCQCSLLFGWLTAELLYRHSSRSLGDDLSRPINRPHWEGHLRLSPEEKGKEGEAEEEKKRSSSGGSGASENQKRCVRREVKESGSVCVRKGKRKVGDVTREEKKEGDEATGWGGTRTSGDRGREIRRLWFN